VPPNFTTSLSTSACSAGALALGYAKYMRDCTRLLDWIATNTQIKAETKQNFNNTDYAFKLYNQTHPDERMIPPKEPKRAAEKW